MACTSTVPMGSDLVPNSDENVPNARKRGYLALLDNLTSTGRSKKKSVYFLYLCSFFDFHLC